MVEFEDKVKQEVGGPALEVDGEVGTRIFFFEFFYQGLAVYARFFAGFFKRDVSLTAEIDAVMPENGSISVVAGDDLACGHGVEFFHVCSGVLQVFFQFGLVCDGDTAVFEEDGTFLRQFGQYAGQ